MSTSFPHLRSPVSCLFYQFTFKRYIEDDIFTDRELECIRHEIVSAVRQFDQLTQDRYDLQENCRLKPLTAVVAKPWTTLFYHFLFDTSFKNRVPLSGEDVEQIHSELVELAERFKLLEAYRACQNAMFSETEMEPSTTSSGIHDTSENHNEVDKELIELHSPNTASDGDSDTVKVKCMSSRDWDAHAVGNSLVSRLTKKELHPLPYLKDLTVETMDQEGKEATLNFSVINSGNGSRPRFLSESVPESESAEIGIPRLRRTGFAESSGIISKEPAELNSTPSNISSLDADSGFRSVSCKSKPKEITSVVSALVRTPFASRYDSFPELVPHQNLGDPRSRLRLTDFAKPYEGIEVILFGTRVKRFDGKGLNRPLGVTFDEVLQQWVVADTLNNRIVLIPRGNIMMSPKLIEPCAVTVLQPAVSFAVLTKYEIRIMYYGKSESNVVVGHSGTARGLATTSLGNLITMEKILGFWQVSVYEGKPAAKLLWSCPYPAMNNALPSFLDVYRGTLVVTDLGTQSIVKFLDATGTDGYKYNSIMTLEANPRSPKRGTVSYMSGVYIDDDMNMLIADAKGRSLQVFNSNCVYLYSVKLQSGGFPYISGLWVNRGGFIGVCARGQKDGGLHVYHMRKPV